MEDVLDTASSFRSTSFLEGIMWLFYFYVLYVAGQGLREFRDFKMLELIGTIPGGGKAWFEARWKVFSKKVLPWELALSSGLISSFVLLLSKHLLNLNLEIRITFLWIFLLVEVHCIYITVLYFSLQGKPRAELKSFGIALGVPLVLQILSYMIPLSGFEFWIYLQFSYALHIYIQMTRQTKELLNFKEEEEDPFEVLGKAADKFGQFIERICFQEERRDRDQ